MLYCLESMLVRSMRDKVLFASSHRLPNRAAASEPDWWMPDISGTPGYFNNSIKFARLEVEQITII
jgi:hypothetical protein